MKTTGRSTTLLAAAFLLLAPVMAGADHHAVKVAAKEGVGSYLTDAKGMTLYTFKRDMPGMSHCEGACLEKWPIYYREAVDPKGGPRADDFGTISRADGKKQTTYKGWPLYYFAGDRAAGDTNGNDMKDVWYAAAP